MCCIVTKINSFIKEHIISHPGVRINLMTLNINTYEELKMHLNALRIPDREYINQLGYFYSVYGNRIRVLCEPVQNEEFIFHTEIEKVGKKDNEKS